MNLTFLGGSETVTGSNYYLEHKNTKFLVDFGLYQEDEKDNSKINFDPKSINFVLLTHAHIDHVGRIPLLFKEGFKGKIYCSYATKDLSEIMLKDSAMIQKKQTELINEAKSKAGLDPVDPLYSMEDVENALAYFYPVDFNKNYKESENISFTFFPSGHILGSASILVKNLESSFLFSGDIGNNNNLLLPSSDFKKSPKNLIIESTYGNRLHDSVEERQNKLGNFLLNIYKNKTVGLIPSFSLGRTQNLIIELEKLLANPKFSVLKNLPIYIDSPLGLKATKIYEEYKELLRNDFHNKKNIFKIDSLRFLSDLKDTFKVIHSDNPKLIISSSGMCNGGKILFYIKEYIEDPSANILFIGYQAEKTLGRKILNKEETIKIGNKIYKNNWSISKISGYSAHGDQNDIIEYIKNLNSEPENIFITHGEEDSRNELKEKLKNLFSSKIILPNEKNKFDI